MTTTPTDNAGETRDAELNLIRAVISAYHTTRLSEVSAESHISAKPGFKRALAAFLAAAPQPEKAGEEAPVAWRVRFKGNDGSMSGWCLSHEGLREYPNAEVIPLYARVPSQQAVVSEGMVEAGLTANDIAGIIEQNADADADADKDGLHNASQLAEKIYRALQAQGASEGVGSYRVGDFIGRQPALCSRGRGVMAGARYHWKREGVLRVEPNGSARFLTFAETLFFIFGGRP
jgi:hypothetical protein